MNQHAKAPGVQPDAALTLTGVMKKFGTKTAVDGISFSVPRGQVLALLGPNGAGKTTTIEMCEGFQKPTAGSISVLGLNPTTQAAAVREKIGIMLQGGGAYPGIRVGEMLKLVASYSAEPHDPEWLLDLVGLSEHTSTSYRRLSGGQQQRLSLAAALISRPELVFLDEPTAGMDAQSRLKVWEVIKQLRSDGVTVVLTTHLMDEAEALADQVVIIDHGRVVAAGTPSALMQANGSQHAGIHMEATSELELSLLRDTLRQRGLTVSAGDIVALKPLSYRLSVAPSPESIAIITAAAAEQSVLIRHLSIDSSSLEDVFLDLTGHELRS